MGAFFATLLAVNFAMAVALRHAPPRWHDPEYGRRLDMLRARQREHPGRPLVVALGTNPRASWRKRDYVAIEHHN